jgi:MFS superfamily sulfate permease-like transporter
MVHIRSSLSTSFVIALLGFFESSVAAKGLGDGAGDGITGAPVSANREMVALGMANVPVACSQLFQPLVDMEGVNSTHQLVVELK